MQYSVRLSQNVSLTNWHLSPEIILRAKVRPDRQSDGAAVALILRGSNMDRRDLRYIVLNRCRCQRLDIAGMHLIRAQSTHGQIADFETRLKQAIHYTPYS